MNFLNYKTNLFTIRHYIIVKNLMSVFSGRIFVNNNFRIVNYRIQFTLVGFLLTCFNLPLASPSLRSVLSSASNLLFNEILISVEKVTKFLTFNNTFIIYNIVGKGVRMFIMNFFFGTYAAMLLHKKQLNSFAISAFTVLHVLLMFTLSPKFALQNINSSINLKSKQRPLIN